MKRIAIIDDEADARQALRSLLELCPGVEICGEADSAASGFEMLKKAQPHAVLLDISMGDASGFDLLDKFPKVPFRVIFTTAHDEFALRAFRYNALDYLLKPIDPRELMRAIERIEIDRQMGEFNLKIQQLLDNMKRRELDKIAISSQEGLVFLRLDHLIRLESEGNYTTFFMANKEKYVASKPIKEYEEMLPADVFFRTHQSHIVQMAFIKKILKEDGGYAEMEDGSKIPIARRRKEEFLAKALER